MAVAPQTPVTALEGIGPATGRALEAIGVHFVFDLLRVPVERIHAAASQASISEVRRWRWMAGFLHVSAMTPQWAEALARGGVRTIGDLRRKKLDALEAIFAQAKADHAISKVPTTIEAAEMLKHAALLDRSGALMGRVVNSLGKPIKEATVRIGSLRETTDAHGRFRVVGIPLSRPPRVEIDHPKHRPLRGTLRRVPSFDALRIHVFKLARLARGAGKARPVKLSELAGDRVPVPAGEPVDAVEVRFEDFGRGDVVRLIHLYANGTEAKLVSKFLGYEDGRFIVRWARAPRESLPREAKLRDHFRVGREGLVPIRWSPHRALTYRRMLQLRQRYANRPKPASPLERDAAFRARVAAMAAAGMFRKRVR